MQVGQQVVQQLGAPPELLLSLCARHPSFHLPILNWCQTFSCFLIQTLGISQLRWLSQLDSEDSYIYATDMLYEFIFAGKQVSSPVRELHSQAVS